jgi:hypothetical protein
MEYLFDINIDKNILFNMNKLDLIDKKEEINSITEAQSIIEDPTIINLIGQNKMR